METSKQRTLVFAGFAVLIAAVLYLAFEGAGADALLVIATLVQ
ncbi:hypothetical protein [Bradyrhizobium sp. Leo121]|nr:hypothetical protein [Bradyrhizobium sp. Leo121]